MAGAGTSAHVSERDGAEFLDGDLCVDDVLPGHDLREPSHASTGRGQTSWVGILTYRAARRGAAGLVCTPGAAGDHSPERNGFAEHHFLVGTFMNLDIRLPIGILFSLLGGILAGYGLLGDASRNEQSLGVNLNVGWGFVLLVFGLVMFVFGRRAMREAGRKTAPRS